MKHKKHYKGYENYTIKHHLCLRLNLEWHMCIVNPDSLARILKNELTLGSLPTLVVIWTQVNHLLDWINQHAPKNLAGTPYSHNTFKMSKIHSKTSWYTKNQEHLSAQINLINWLNLIFLKEKSVPNDDPDVWIIR